ncbi:hypothetical protein ACHRV5_11880 [Flavobacterium sp. FlaQc-52]|jgi:uncharacterized protein YbdZ (MbtH family)|uniref:hypothetical protein n=1 Tax=Flavobacterium sp. FlaQc-52 TaxID=3374185 RepID=UPI003757C1A2
MKFNIEYYSGIIRKELLYLENECSFYMDYKDLNADLELIINKIALQIFNNRVFALSGFCGLNKEMLTNIKVPKSKKGILKVEHNLDYGFSYGVSDIFDYEYSVYVNIETGWVCIGNPYSKENAVEFIDNCIVVINDDGIFNSLWLKPKSLPKIE